jgi:Domain of unknown function (DUF5134)
VAGHSWLVDAIALPLLLTATYCATRPFISRIRQRRIEADVDAMHVVMGPAMAAMLAGWLDTEWTKALGLVFLAGVGWFGSGAVRAGLRAGPGNRGPGHHMEHLAACAAMVYMLGSASFTGMATMAAGPGMSSASSGPGGIEVLAVALGVALIAYAVRDFSLMTVSPASVPVVTDRVAARPVLAPRMAGACQVVMGLAMGAMLVATI